LIADIHIYFYAQHIIYMPDFFLFTFDAFLFKILRYAVELYIASYMTCCVEREHIDLLRYSVQSGCALSAGKLGLNAYK